MAKEYIIRKLGEMLFFMRNDTEDILNVISFSTKLEALVDRKYILEYESLDESTKNRFLRSMAGFQINEKWDTTEINYTNRIKHDAYVYYCQLGFEHEKDFDPDMHIRRFLEKGCVEIEDCERLWRELSKLYYMVYERIASFSEYIPQMIDSLIAETHSSYKELYDWYREDQRDIEDVLFMYGILHEIIIMINEENLIKQTIVNKSGERQVAPF